MILAISEPLKHATVWGAREKIKLGSNGEAEKWNQGFISSAMLEILCSPVILEVANTILISRLEEYFSLPHGLSCCLRKQS